MIPLRIQLLTETAKVPRYQTEHAAGLDLHADISAPLQIPAGERRLISTGIAVAIPVGFEGTVRPRSGLATREGAATVLGTIDADYRGEVKILLCAIGDEAVIVRPGDRIAQLVVSPVARVLQEVVVDLGATKRGANGFGSTGAR